MRVALMVAIVTAAALTSAAQAQPYVKGNDTGGIIQWSCEAEAAAKEIAASHCGWYGKHPRITSVHRQYGDYISFQCLWNSNQARFATPAVYTRSVCRTPVRGYGPAIRARY